MTTSRQPAPPGRLLRLPAGAVLTALVLLAILVRVVYFAQLGDSPCIRQHRWAPTDMHFFDAWAQRIVAGDPLTREPLHPLVDWHWGVAQAWLQEHPEPGATVESLWNTWYGGRTFHQEPLYVWLLALTYLVFGRDPRWMLAWQMLAGVGSVVLVWALAKRHFGAPAAAAAGLLAILCGPLLFYDLVLLRTSLMVFAGLGLAWLGGIALDRGGRGAWAALGIAFGASLLLNSTFVLFGIGVAGLMMWRAVRRSPNGSGRTAAPRPLAGGIAFAAGTVLALSPAIGRNLAVGAPPLSLSAIGPLAFLCSNTPDFDPRLGFFVSMEHVPRILGRTGGRALPMALETLKTHSGPLGYGRLLLAKLDWTWRWYEMPNNKNFYYYRLHAPVLRWLPVTFLALAPLGLVGMALAGLREARRRRAPGTAGVAGPAPSAAPLFLLAAATFLPLVIFYPLSRFRAGLLSALIPFAGFAVVDIARRVRDGRWRSAAAALGAAILIGLAAGRPLPAGMPLIRTADWIAAHEVDYIPRLQEAEARQDWTAAAAVLDEALRVVPEIVAEAGPGRPARDEIEATQLMLFIPVFERQRLLLERAGQTARSEEIALRVEELQAALPGSQQGG